MNVIKVIKKNTFLSARENALQVLDSHGVEVGELVPIGAWALKDENLIESFCAWRKLFMRFFLVQSESSIQSTYRYLDQLAIKSDDRILFALYVDGILTGHIGLCDIGQDVAEADNIMRGKSGGHKDLMLLCEIALLNWSFETLGVTRVMARILSKNFLSQALFARLGFQTIDRMPLRKVIEDSRIIMRACAHEHATETFTLDLLEVTKDKFIKQVELYKRTEENFLP